MLTFYLHFSTGLKLGQVIWVMFCPGQVGIICFIYKQVDILISKNQVLQILYFKQYI